MILRQRFHGSRFGGAAGLGCHHEQLSHPLLKLRAASCCSAADGVLGAGTGATEGAGEGTAGLVTDAGGDEGAACLTAKKEPPMVSPLRRILAGVRWASGTSGRRDQKHSGGGDADAQ